MSDESTSEAPQPSEMAMLRAEMRAGFQSVGKRFDDVDKRFDGVDKRFDGVDNRLDGVDQRFDGIDKRFDGIDKRFDGVDKRFDGVDKRLDGVDARLGGHDKRFDEVDKRLVTMDARITDEAAATRRHFDVVAEGLRESFNVVIDKTTATGEKVDRLIASNAIEHAAFIDGHTDHEVRITRLEAVRGKRKPTTT
jgi:archaellum component FlaC